MTSQTVYSPDYNIEFGKKYTRATLDDGQRLTLVQNTAISYGGERYKRAYEGFYKQAFIFADSARTKILFMILRDLPFRSCRYIGTVEQIAERAGVKRSAAFDAIRDMQKMNFIKRVQNGVWMVNPAFITDSDEIGRQRLMETYIHLNEDENKGDQK